MHCILWFRIQTVEEPMTCLCSMMSEDSAEKTQITGDDSTKQEVDIIQKLLHS